MIDDDLMVTVMVLDENTVRLGRMLHEDLALTLIAVMSEDPSCWEEVVGYWPRYRTPAVCEFATAIPWQEVDRAAATKGIDDEQVWVVLDLIQKRIVTGRQFMPVGRDQAFAMVVDDDGNQHCPLSVHLPPWWELHEQVDANVIDARRQSPINRPVVDREILFGDALLCDLATRILTTAGSDDWKASDAAENERSRYDFTINVHRDWLMTPRDDLHGRIPRELLHGARGWMDRIVWAQRLRFEDGGPMVAAPDDVAGYASAPMGLEEMVIYFDLCRELISSGWFWSTRGSEDEGTQSEANRHQQLVAFLRDVKEEWLASPFEGGSPPCFIIECSRRRVPRGAGVPIVGMSQCESEQHEIDCDCPLCNMMAEGLFGVGFTSLDGHHLDLDNEFAFSTHQTREAWEEMLREYEQMSAEMDRKSAERQAANANAADEFASVWSSAVSDQRLPGDSTGHIKLAFLLAEIVSNLESNQASPSDIRQLNEDFTQFRNCQHDRLAESAERLKASLDSVTQRYPELISKAADFQSRIDEHLCAQVWEDDSDIPF